MQRPIAPSAILFGATLRALLVLRLIARSGCQEYCCWRSITREPVPHNTQGLCGGGSPAGFSIHTGLLASVPSLRYSIASCYATISMFSLLSVCGYRHEAAMMSRKNQWRQDGMKFALFTGLTGITWTQLRDLWQHIEATGWDAACVT